MKCTNTSDRMQKILDSKMLSFGQKDLSIELKFDLKRYGHPEGI
ncbi:MAG TPA: hypothetical protein V6C84_21580 [Coleofasciculaceae cyanobacterium]